MEEEKNPKQRQKSALENSSDLEEEGQIQIPKDVVLETKGLVHSSEYLVCYLRQKTEQELQNEQLVSLWALSF